jgi:hypothetical protein
MHEYKRFHCLFVLLYFPGLIQYFYHDQRYNKNTPANNISKKAYSILGTSEII